MKNVIFIFLLGASIWVKAQTHTLNKIWETDTIIAIPESVLPDINKNILYVSSIDVSLTR